MVKLQFASCCCVLSCALYCTARHSIAQHTLPTQHKCQKVNKHEMKMKIHIRSIQHSTAHTWNPCGYNYLCAVCLCKWICTEWVRVCLLMCASVRVRASTHLSPVPKVILFIFMNSALFPITAITPLLWLLLKCSPCFRTFGTHTSFDFTLHYSPSVFAFPPSHHSMSEK